MTGCRSHSAAIRPAPSGATRSPGGALPPIHPFDADTVGTESVAADAEICMLAADTMEAQVSRRGYAIKVPIASHRRVLDEVGLSMPRAALRLRASTNTTAWPGWVEQLLGAGRKDESGDFTKGAGITSPRSSACCLYNAAKMSPAIQSLAIRQTRARTGRIMCVGKDVGDSDANEYCCPQQRRTIASYARALAGMSWRWKVSLSCKLSQSIKLEFRRWSGYDRPAVVRGLNITLASYEAELT